jgi:hypothetical protein
MGQVMEPGGGPPGGPPVDVGEFYDPEHPDPQHEDPDSQNETDNPADFEPGVGEELETGDPEQIPDVADDLVFGEAEV